MQRCGQSLVHGCGVRQRALECCSRLWVETDDTSIGQDLVSVGGGCLKDKGGNIHVGSRGRLLEQTLGCRVDANLEAFILEGGHVLTMTVHNPPVKSGMSSGSRRYDALAWSAEDVMKATVSIPVVRDPQRPAVVQPGHVSDDPLVQAQYDALFYSMGPGDPLAPANGGGAAFQMTMSHRGEAPAPQTTLHGIRKPKPQPRH